MTPADKAAQIIADLTLFDNYEDRFQYIIEKGRQAPGLEDDKKIPRFRIDGCVSDLWLYPEFKENRCYFRTDSNAYITKGIAAILSDVYSNATPEEILAVDPIFLEKAGITQHLTPNRRNGLSQICKKIYQYATAFRESTLNSSKD